MTGLENLACQHIEMLCTSEGLKEAPMITQVAEIKFTSNETLTTCTALVSNVY